MPRYDYKCKKCNKNFEVVRGIHENHENQEKCRECGGPVRRVFHPVGIVFKGSGFYATDSRGKDKHFKAAEEEAKPAASEKATPSKKEDKGKEKKAEDSVKAAT